jgi:hypothetical protein
MVWSFIMALAWADMVCGPGREPPPDVPEACCWPGQVWQDNACTGKPTACPADRPFDGETCSPATAAAAVSSSEEVLRGQEAAWASAPQEALEVVHQVRPHYPYEAKARGLGEQACQALVWLDSEGIPAKVAVADCHVAFHDEAERALLAWRWPAVEGVTVTQRLTRAEIVFQQQSKIIRKASVR